MALGDLERSVMDLLWDRPGPHTAPEVEAPPSEAPQSEATPSETSEQAEGDQ